MFIFSCSPSRTGLRQKRRTRSLLSSACVAVMLVPGISYGAETGFGSERLINEDQKYLGVAMGKGGRDLEDAIAPVDSNFVASLGGDVSGVRPDATKNAVAAAGQIVPGMTGMSGDRLTRSDRAMIQEARRRSVGDIDVAVQRVIFNQATVDGFVANIRPELARDVAYASTRAMPGSYRNVVHVLDTESVVNALPSESAYGAVRLSAAQGVARAVSFDGVSEQRKMILADIIEDVGLTNLAAVNRTVKRTPQGASSASQPSAAEKLRTARGETRLVASITAVGDDSGALRASTDWSGSAGESQPAELLFAQAGGGSGCEASGAAIGTSDRATLRTAAARGDAALSNAVTSAIQQGVSGAHVVTQVVTEFPEKVNLTLTNAVKADPAQASSMVCAAAENVKDVDPGVLVVIANQAGAKDTPELIAGAARGSGKSIRSVLTSVSRVANLTRNDLAKIVNRLVALGHGSGDGGGDGDSPGSLKNPLTKPTVVASIVKDSTGVVVGVSFTLSYTSPN